jgi:hypothetical protein
MYNCYDAPKLFTVKNQFETVKIYLHKNEANCMIVLRKAANP